MNKPIGDMAKYIQSILPGNIPLSHPLRPMFRRFGEEERVWRGMTAFRDFLSLALELVITDGDLFDNPPKVKVDGSNHHVSLPSCYPFLNHLRNLLFNIGYHGMLASNGNTIIVEHWRSLTFTMGLYGAEQAGKISVPKVVETLRFLTDCGLRIDGIPLEDEKPDLRAIERICIEYPDDPLMPLGLKVMAIANRDLNNKGNDDAFLRCDYRLLMEGGEDTARLLAEHLRSLPGRVRDFALELHRRSEDKGLRCEMNVVFLNIRFVYYDKNREIWSFSLSFDSGFRVLVRAKKTHEYTDTIQSFSPMLQEIIAKGYGCERKRYGLPCQKGCHGYSLPLDDTLVRIGGDLETWIDKERGL